MPTDSAAERMKFVTLTRQAFFDENQNNAETIDLNSTTKKKLERLLREQDDDNYLARNQMPKVCKGMDYKGPVVAKHGTGDQSGNNFVCTNETHSRATNNGFTRSEGGAFYAH